MRDYLRGFFDEYEFTARERVAVALAYERIAECPKARERFTALLDGYEKDTRFLRDEHLSVLEGIGSAAGVHPYTVILLAVIVLSRTLRSRLLGIGLSRRVVAGTLADVLWKTRECERLHGVVGTEHWSWYVRFLELRLFGVGRLQFELKAYDGEPYEKDGKRLTAGERVLAVHIPDSGTPLEERLCNAAYRDAKKIFTMLLGVSDIPFVCSSWLLYPKNRDFLDPKSNIVKFMSRYDTVKVENYRKDRNAAIPYLFGAKMSTPTEELAEKTSLQRAYKAHLLEGGRMGYGTGIFFLEN